MWRTWSCDIELEENLPACVNGGCMHALSGKPDGKFSDHDDDDDTKRGSKTNKEKNDSIDIELACTVPEQFWPKAWHGVLGGA